MRLIFEKLYFMCEIRVLTAFFAIIWCDFEEDPMDKLDTKMLADDLALSQDKILNGEQDFGAEAVYKVIDNLGVLNNPIKDTST